VKLRTLAIQTPFKWHSANKLLKAASPVLQGFFVPVIALKHPVAIMPRPGLPQSLQLSATLALLLVFGSCSVSLTRGSQVIDVQQADWVSGWQKPSASCDSMHSLTCLESFDVQAPAAAADSDCALTSELEEGPFYINDTLFRSTITEDQAGLPLTLRVKAVDTSCNPLMDAFIDIWSCNSTGSYSGYTSEPAQFSVQIFEVANPSSYHIRRVV